MKYACYMVFTLTFFSTQLFAANISNHIKFTASNGTSVSIKAEALPIGSTLLELQGDSPEGLPFDFNAELLPLFELTAESQRVFNLLKSSRYNTNNLFLQILNDSKLIKNLSLELYIEFFKLVDYFNFDDGIKDAVAHYLVKNIVTDQQLEQKAVSFLNPGLIKFLAKYIYLIHSRDLLMPAEANMQALPFDQNELEFSISDLFAFGKFTAQDVIKQRLQMVAPNVQMPSLAIDLSQKKLSSLEGFEIIYFMLAAYRVPIIAIDISRNNITEIDRGFLQLFKQFTHIVQIDAHANKLRTLPDDFIQNFAYLTTVDLSNNLLSTLPKNFGLNCPQLVLLNASHNKIEKADLTNAPNLVIIDLNHNRLKTIPSLQQFNFVGSLLLSSNAIESLEDVDFTLFTNLQNLLLDNNVLVTSPVIENLTNLIFLNLSNNFLTNAPLCTYCPQLQEINLDNNDISELPNHFAANSPLLHQIGISNNLFSPETLRQIPNYLQPFLVGTDIQRTQSKKRTHPESDDTQECSPLKKTKIADVD